MNRAIEWFAHNGVAANLLMILIIGGGLVTLPRIKREIFPEISLDIIQVSVEYLGASPEEVEEAVCMRVEEQVQGLEGIKRITSTASEGIGFVRLEVLDGFDTREVLDDVKARVDAIDTFPAETEKPVVQELLNRRQVINIAISGAADEFTIKSLGAQVRDEITALPGITLAELVNARPYEVSIEVSEQTLRRYGLTFDQVAQAVRRSSLDLPAGSLRTRGGEILLRTKGQAYRRPDFEKIVLIARADGTRLLLGDVATVVDGFSETDQSARFDGSPTSVVQVFRVGNQNALEVADAVQDYVVEAQARMPEGIRLTTWRDSSTVLRGRLDLLIRNGRMGFLLVFLVLALFLRFRLAVWVSIGIPVSFLGAFALMPSLDVSVNLISLFAFIVVLGIVVDDAIVVGESIYTHQRRSRDPLRSSIEGARSVSVPVVFAVLTTVAAFAPLLGVAGNMGKIMRVIPLIVIPTLIFSLVESLFVLPNHLSHTPPHGSERRRIGPIRAWVGFQDRFASGLEWFIQNVYRPSLARALEWRYATLAWGLATLLITVGLVAGGRVRFTFFPAVEADYVAAILTMPQGTPADVTAEAVRRLEESAREVQQRLDAQEELDGSVFRHALASVGEQPYRTSQANNGPGGGTLAFTGSNLGEVTIELVPAEDRQTTSTEIAAMWREATGPIPDALELVYTASLFSPGEPIHVQLKGPDIEQLSQAAEALKESLQEYPGVLDVTDSFRAGKQEVKLQIRPAAETLGLRLSDLARQVRQAFYGEEAQRIQRGRDEVRIMVRYPEAERRSLGDLESMRIRTASGAQVPFSEVAVAELGRGYASIQRTDRRRSVDVTADVDPTRNNANVVLADLEANVIPGILADHAGVTYTLEGQRQEQRETMGGLARGFMIALLVIYGLMAVPFRSYVQPMIVMSAIPFGLVGAIWGHVIMRMDLTIITMFGVVALTGVVVNDSLVLVDRINRKRQAGMPLEEAVRAGGISRFRPIILTSLTTFMGLTPLLLEKSMQARFLIPMATSLAFGVIFSTFVILVIVPASYLILEDLRSVPRRLLGRDVAAAIPATDEGV
jgi:multidrug efflux pump subunit AcrB